MTMKTTDSRHLPHRSEIAFEPLSLVLLSLVFLVVVVVVFMMGFYFGKSHESAQGREAATWAQNFSDQGTVAGLLPPPFDTTFGEILAKESRRPINRPVAVSPLVQPPSDTVPVIQHSNPIEPPADDAPQVERYEDLVEKKTTAKKDEVLSPPSDYFAIQVGAFPKKEQAKTFIENFKKQGVGEVYFGPTHYGSSGKFYRVWMGKFASEAKARQRVEALNQTKKTKYFVVHFNEDRGGQTVGYSEKPSQAR